jgi:hypothetical protein
MRFLKLLSAQIRCNFHLLFHFLSQQQIIFYDENNKIIFIAAVTTDFIKFNEETFTISYNDNALVKVFYQQCK